MTKQQNTSNSYPARSPTIYNEATSIVHWKALIKIFIIKIYILWNDTHIMGNVSPPADITKNHLVNSKKKIMKTLGKTKTATLYGFTHSAANHWRRTSVNAFLDFWTNIFHEAMNCKIFNKITSKFSYSYVPNPKAKTDRYTVSKVYVYITPSKIKKTRHSPGTKVYKRCLGLIK